MVGNPWDGTLNNQSHTLSIVGCWVYIPLTTKGFLGFSQLGENPSIPRVLPPKSTQELLDPEPLEGHEANFCRVAASQRRGLVAFFLTEC